MARLRNPFDPSTIGSASSVAVIGLGRFGTALALELMAHGTEVLGIDADEHVVQDLNGRLTAVVTGVLFLLAVFVTPLASMVPFVATGPVLIVVGYLMATLIKDIDFNDVEEGFPALLGIVLMPLTYNITVGIGAGFMAHVLLKVALGKTRQVNGLMWVVAGLFVVYFAIAPIRQLLGVG